MVWMLVAAAGASLAQSAMASRAANKATVAQSERAVILDKMTLQSTLKSIENLNVERAGVRRQVQTALAHTTAQKNLQAGSVAANAGASDTMGASVLATLQDVAMKADEAASTLRLNLGTQEERLNRSIQDVINQGISNMQGGQVGSAISGKEMATSAAIAAGTTAIQSWASTYKPQTSAPTSSSVTVGANYGTDIKYSAGQV